MNDTTLESPGLSRRSLLKVGLLGSAFLATAGLTATLSGCSASVPASGLSILRSSDLPFLRTLIPVVIEGSVSAEDVASRVVEAIESERFLILPHPEVADIPGFLSLPRAILVAVLLIVGFYPRLVLDVVDPATRALEHVLR